MEEATGFRNPDGDGLYAARALAVSRQSRSLNPPISLPPYESVPV